MNNDFNYRPTQPKSQAEPEEPVDAEPEASEPQEEPVPTSHVVTSKGGSGGLKKLLGFLGILILLAAAAGGVYYWQHKKFQDADAARDQLSAKVDSLQAQLGEEGAVQPEPKPAPGTTSPTSQPADTFYVITGAPGKLTANEADVTASYSFKNMPTEVWVESGTQPDKLTTVSAHKKTSSEGSGDYGAEGFGITGLKAGTVYYYRAAGTVSGKTVYGGVVTFTTPNATL